MEPPLCSHCGGPIRPGVVWFGESLPSPAWDRAEQVLQACDALLVVGTSGVVQPAADLPRLVKRRRKPVIEVNPARSEITPTVDVYWDVTAAEGLPKVVELLRGRPNKKAGLRQIETLNPRTSASSIPGFFLAPRIFRILS